ncbi:MAG: type II toxin-antitoxin system VapC family toxin [Lewinella sp.]
MKKLFIDTNVIMDLLTERPPFYQPAAKLFIKADKEKIQLYASALTFANLNYILTRLYDAAKARTALRKLELLVSIHDLTEKITLLSLNDEAFSDFEDGLQYYTALENNMDVIITRNLKDFKASALPVMTAEAYLKV